MSVIIHNAYPNSAHSLFINLCNQTNIVFFRPEAGYIYLQFRLTDNGFGRCRTSSPKVHADLYIDDSSLGCPIRFVDGVKRPVADWTRIREQLVREGFLD